MMFFVSDVPKWIWPWPSALALALPDVGDSCRTFEIPAERSKFWPDVQRNEYEKMKSEAQKWASRISR